MNILEVIKFAQLIIAIKVLLTLIYFKYFFFIISCIHGLKLLIAKKKVQTIDIREE